MATSPLPVAFIQQIEALMSPREAEAFFEALEQPAPTSIRYNPFKTGVQPSTDPVPWCRYGNYLAQRPIFTLDPLFHGGTYYVQEAASMFVEHLFRSLLEPRKALRVLDLCAAPGGKSTLLSTLVGTEGVVVANEVIRNRAQVLVENVKKWGIGNVAVTCNDPAHFGAYKHYFDFILVDAPCSGEGMFRKTPQARAEWSLEGVKLSAARDRRILGEVWESLRPGGIMLFTTCTLNETENEGTVGWIQQNYDCQGVSVPCDSCWGVVQGEVAGIPTFRFYPHRTRGEGFFAAALRKAEGKVRESIPKPRKKIFSCPSKAQRLILEEWFAQSEYMKMATIGEQFYAYYEPAFEIIDQLSEGLAVIYSGTLAGQLFGGKLKPDHSLGLFHDLATATTPRVDLPLELALDYLRKRDVEPTLFEEGMNLVTFQQLPLGWIKRIGARVNNMYPKESRIVSL